MKGHWRPLQSNYCLFLQEVCENGRDKDKSEKEFFSGDNLKISHGII